MFYKDGNIDDFLTSSRSESDADMTDRERTAKRFIEIMPALSKILMRDDAERVAYAIIAGKIPHVKYVG